MYILIPSQMAQLIKFSYYGTIEYNPDKAKF